MPEPATLHTHICTPIHTCAYTQLNPGEGPACSDSTGENQGREAQGTRRLGELLVLCVGCLLLFSIQLELTVGEFHSVEFTVGQTPFVFSQRISVLFRSFADLVM